MSFSSGTAAFHAAVSAAGLTSGDQAITTPLTFAATANCILNRQATPVFADISPDTLNLDPERIVSQITSRTKAILPVDYAGHPADLDRILQIAEEHNLIVIEDACHAVGAEYRARRVGCIAPMTVFSFHPAKHITTGEGGMVTTNDVEFARSLRSLRNHGINSEARQRPGFCTMALRVVLLGFNGRLSDIACALGTSQLKKLDLNLARRRQIAARYSSAFSSMPALVLPSVYADVSPAWHLYPIRLELEKLTVSRDQILTALRAENIGDRCTIFRLSDPYYRVHLGYSQDGCPVAEDAYNRLISLPMFHGMSDCDVEDVTPPPCAK